MILPGYLYIKYTKTLQTSYYQEQDHKGSYKILKSQELKQQMYYALLT
jgi:hypothetical protein